MFFHDEEFQGLYPLLMLNDQLYLSEEDLKMLINRDDEYARAAIFQMQVSGAAILLFAERGTATKLDKTSVQRFLSLAENEGRLRWQFFIAVAAVKAHTFKLLPWLIKVVENTPFREDRTINYFYPSYEKIKESWLAMIIRAIGYLARLLLDNRDEKAKLP